VPNRVEKKQENIKKRKEKLNGERNYVKPKKEDTKEKQEEKNNQRFLEKYIYIIVI